MPEVVTLTREKKHAVVASLARGRSIAMTAERCHVPAGVVQLLRDNYGPDLPRLEAAAHELAKLAATPAGVPAPRQPQPSPEPTMTVTTTPTPTPTTTPAPKPSIAGIVTAIDAHMDGVTDPRILKLHERAAAALTALVDALDAHRKAAKVNAEIAALEAQLAKARDERAKITGTTKATKVTKATASDVDAKAVRAWAHANGVPVGAVGRPKQSVVDAWRAAGSPTP